MACLYFYVIAEGEIQYKKVILANAGFDLFMHTEKIPARAMLLRCRQEVRKVLIFLFLINPFSLFQLVAQQL